MLEGLDRGIAGASVLAKCNGVALRVIDVGIADGAVECDWSNNTVRTSDNKLKDGTKSFCQGCAMTEEEVKQCLESGREETGKFINEMGGNIVLFGEVGIGNTTTSSALIAALTDVDLELLCGTGASTTRDGIKDELIAKKISIIVEAMQYHEQSTFKGKPLQALEAVGGAEIAAMVGGMLEASERDIPILVDGFIVTTAAMIACLLDPRVTRVLLFATKSTEKGQTAALDVIGKLAQANDIPVPAPPALDMALRMGEGTGSLLCLPLARSACAILRELATLNDLLQLEM